MSVAEHLFAQFVSRTGDQLGPAIKLPADTTVEQLHAILHVDDVDILTSLQADLKAAGVKVSDEAILSIRYQPQATFRVWPASRCSATLRGHEAPILCTAFSPCGKRLASGSGDCTVRFWDLTTNTPFTLGKVHNGWILCLAWSPDGKYLASGSMDNRIQIWDGQTGKAIGSPLSQHTKWITSLAWEPVHLKTTTGLRLASGSKDGTVKIWDVINRSCLQTLGQHTDAISAVKWSGDGTIYTASRDRTIRMWTADGRCKAKLEGHGHWINSLAISSDFALRTGAHGLGNQLKGEGEREVALARFQELVGGEPERIVSGSDDFTMFLWCPSQSNKPLARLTGHQGLVNQVAFSPDGRYLASASFDKSVKLWSARTGKFIATLRGHVGPVYQIAWSADSRLLLSASRDSTAKIWEISQRKLLNDLPGHADEVYAVDWSPQGDRAVSGGKDCQLKIWSP